MGGSSSKTQFTHLISRLLSADVDPAEHDFWDELWKTPLSTEDIFALISPDAVRKLIKERPSNLQTLFTQAVAQLYQVVETPYPVYFDQALNCARLLSRLIPFMLEDAANEDIRGLFWNKQVIPKSLTAEEGGEEGDSGEAEYQETEPLAVILVNSLFHLLFLPDFTIEDPNTDFGEDDVNTPAFKSALMWAPGIGSIEKSVAYSTQYDGNRIDILRVLIAIFSDALYQSPSSYDACASLWLEVATSVDAPYADILFYSLINVVLGYDPMGWGVPYGNLVAKDTLKNLMETAVHVLVILLDYGYPLRPHSIDEATPASTLPVYVSPDDTEAQGFNVFRRLLSNIESADELNFLFKGFSRLLNNVYQAQCTYLPYSITKIDVEQELLVLLWKCLEDIPKFMPYVLRHCDVTELLVPLCYFLLEGRKDPSRLGMLYLCTFTLLKLSGERNFGVALNKPYELHLPVDMPLFSGNHADLLVIVLHKLIVNGVDKLSALYNCFLTIICNISPYCKSLCAVSAVKLVNLLQLFTSPRFLYAAEGNYIYVSLLLETFNNIIQYQYEGNVNLVYAIVKRKDVFEKLAALTLPSAIKGAADAATKIKPQQRASGAPVPPESVDTAADGPPTDLVSTRMVERTAATEKDVTAAVNPPPTQDNGERHAESKHTAPSSDDSQKQQAPNSNDSTTTPNPSRFIPNQIWLNAVKAEMPLNTISRLLKYLVPQIDDFVSSKNMLEESLVLDFIRKTTMVGLLPVPHPIVIRKYQPNHYTSLWFTAFMWGVIFMHNQDVPLFDGRSIRLFVVQTVR